MMIAEQIMDFIGSLMERYWLAGVGGIAMLILGRWWGRRKDKAQWKSKDYHDRLNVSLNSITSRIVRDPVSNQKTLRIRTLFEDSAELIVKNQEARAILMKAAALTTEDDPIIPLPPMDRWFILNEILNEVAERFCIGTLKADLERTKTHLGRYVICLTNEIAGDVRIRKIRAMVLHVRELERCREGVPERWVLESPNHQTRVKTIQAMRKRYIADPSYFLEVELAV